MISRAIGLDLGQSRDYTAIAAVEDDGVQWTVRRLERLPLGTPYPEVVRRAVKAVLATPQPVHLVVDATGLGRVVVDMLKAAGLTIVPVSIIGKGRTTRNSTGAWIVPKGVLMERTAIAMEAGRLKITCDDAMTKAFADEARSFVRTLNKVGNVTYEGRGGAHDDLVLAVALAMWARAETSFAKTMFAAE